jgi:hypothetical protein
MKANSKASAFFAASIIASTAAADFIGWTATVRQVDGGFLVNVFAATNDPGDVILNIAGGSPGIPSEGYVRVVNIPGGFRQGSDAAGVFRPTSGQGWTSLDSFLTVGGGFDSATGAWSGNLITQGDPPWVVTYQDTELGPVSVNGFDAWTNSTGFVNPYVNVIPSTGGWFIAGVTSPARSFGAIQSIRLPFESIGGQAYGASSAAAASATHGFMVGQLWVPYLTALGPGNSLIEWKMSANLRRTNGTISNANFQFRIKGTMSPDVDGDGVPNFQDACPEEAGPCGGCPANACSTCGALPDGDGDGRPDCQDNCPSVPNPSQADCNANGIGDACETFTDCNANGVPDSCELANGSALDCNANGVPDSCDIANGSALDCNANGVPDSCDIANGTSGDVDGNGIPDDCKPDCNGNGLPDPWEIAMGRVPDCNGDLVPDTCQGAVAIDAMSPNLGAPSGGESREFVFTGLPLAATGVSLSIDVRGDLDGQTEFIDVVVNGGSSRRFFAADGDDCPDVPNRATLTWTAQEFSALVAATGSLSVRMTCPPTVDPTECKDAGLTIFRLAYFGIGPKGDCDGNRGLDICDVASGASDCNGNSVPDGCDIARGLVPDCNGNGVPDPCEIAGNPAIDCNGNGVPDSCDLAAGGLTVDCDSNGRIDSCQVLEDPAVDCNGNGRPDSCDIAVGGLAVDCDSNGRIDSCQVLEDPAVDCNGNGKPDSCDIAAGTSLDIDGNGRPDECQTVRVPMDFPTIQAAILSAPADQMRIILVSAGTYQGPIDFSGKPVIVRGSDAASTVIQGGGPAKSAVVRFSGGESAIAALERVTVRGGLTGTQPPGVPYFGGGGIYGRQSAANIRQCVVENNAAGIGGGIYLEDCHSTIVATIVRANIASSDGGGLATIGGTVAVTDCTIQSNDSGGRGAGAHLRGGRPSLVRTEIRGNEGATVAAGVAWIPGPVAGDFLVIDDCDIVGNTAGVAQGGIGIQGAAGGPFASLKDTTVCGNVPSPNVSGDWTDLGGNTVCTCLGNLDGDDRVSGDDLGIMLGHWGACTGLPCIADLNGDSVVNGDDLGLMLANWGPCAP